MNTDADTTRVALIVCCKWEERYICEWLDYYRDVVHVDKIFLCDNNEIGYMPDARAVVAPYMRSGFVEYRDYRGVDNIQHVCYSEVFAEIRDDFDWVCIFDVDEFLDLGEHGDIKDYLAEERFAGCDCIQIPWIVMRSRVPALRYLDVPVRDRYPIPAMRCMTNVHPPKLKTIVRCATPAGVKRVSAHFSEFESDNYDCRLWNGERKADCKDIVVQVPDHIHTPDDALAYFDVHLKHYQYKSAEEFMEKIFRGRPSQRSKNAFFRTLPKREVLGIYSARIRYGLPFDVIVRLYSIRLYDKWMRRVREEDRARGDAEALAGARQAGDKDDATGRSEAGAARRQAVAQRAEKLDRGLVAMKVDGGCGEGRNTGIFVSWRMLSSEDPVFGTADSPTTYVLLRDGAEIARLEGKTNYLDVDGQMNSRYAVRVEGAGVTSPEITPFASGANWFDIPLERPIAGPYGPYTIGDVSCGDLDGDGAYELIVKWDSGAKDNAEPGRTGNVLLDAYKLDGTRLWQQPIDLGPNIRAGAHYTQFLVYDFDGDGRSELMLKTAPGSCDGRGRPVSRASRVQSIRVCDDGCDLRDDNGMLIAGDEFLTVFAGDTGAALDTIYYPNLRIDTKLWGDAVGNRSERYTAAVAWLDGVRPYGFFMRGYYWDRRPEGTGVRQCACAVSFDGRHLRCQRGHSFDTFDVDGYAEHADLADLACTSAFYANRTYKGVSGYRPGNEIFVGEGNHNCAVADVDGDGRDEVLTGALCYELDREDRLGVRWCSFRGHGDAMHLGAYGATDATPTFELFTVHEKGGEHPLTGDQLDHGMSVLDAATGRVLFHESSPGDMGRGMMANVGAGGSYQVWGISEVEAGDGDERIHVQPRMRTADGGAFADAERFAPVDIPGATSNFRIFWDGDLFDELLDAPADAPSSSAGSPLEVTSWNPATKRMEPIFRTDGCISINGTKANPCLQADLLGDWREEIVMARADHEALRVFSSPIPSDYSLMTLMHDPVYRAGVAAEQTAYNQPPHIGFHLGSECFFGRAGQTGEGDDA